MIAFGGGGPVHACRVAEKVGIGRVLVPSGAGVGSAIGFLRAPVGYEVVRSLYQRFSTFDVAAVNALLADDARRGDARWSPQGSFGASLTETRIAYMRYVGQGHEIPVPLPARMLTRGRRGNDPRGIRYRIHAVLRSPSARLRCGDHELRRGCRNRGEMPATAPPRAAKPSCPRPCRPATRRCATR